MRILTFSDWHISEKTSLVGGNRRDASGEKRTLKDAARFADWLALQARQQDVDAIVFAGDFFDRSKPTPNEYRVAFDALRQLSKVARVFILVGNHDQTIGRGADATAPFAAAELDNVVVIDKPETAVVTSISDTAKLYFLPYPPARPLAGSKDEANAAVSRDLGLIMQGFALDAAAERDSVARICVAHVTFSGSDYGQDQLVPLTDVQVRTDELSSFDFTVAGHLHKRQQIGGNDRAWYVGTPDRWSFGDEGNDVGAMLLTIDGRDVEAMFLEYPFAREFVSLKIDDYLTFEPDVDLLDRLFVRAVGSTPDPKVYESVVDKTRELARLGLGGLRNDVTMSRRADELPVVEDRENVGALFDAFNRARPTAIPEASRPAVLARVEALVRQA